MSSCALVWLRRDLRFSDHTAFANAHACADTVQPVFIFDTAILSLFPNKDDRRLAFLAETLCHMHATLKARGGQLLVLHGKATELIPRLAHSLRVTHVVAAEDYEPATRKRDAHVGEALSGMAIDFVLENDHLLLHPMRVLRDGKHPYRVFTPYSRAWRKSLTPLDTADRKPAQEKRYHDIGSALDALKAAGLTPLPIDLGAAALLDAIGYRYQTCTLWRPQEAENALDAFVKERLANYHQTRDFPGIAGTSRLSPFLRFGLLSIRHCYRAAEKIATTGAQTWINELIWRDFYGMILMHFPESATESFQPRYRHLSWPKNEALYDAFQEGKTGYPIIDAAVRELRTTGWMHNRARMIVASFFTKNLHLDWRIGETFFRGYLMDYDLSANVGGWQWAASTGTDAQPYFRVFNPFLQSEKYDPDGTYIRRHVPELASLPDKYLHAPHRYPLYTKALAYPVPIVPYEKTRDQAIAMFKKLTSS